MRQKFEISYNLLARTVRDAVWYYGMVIVRKAKDGLRLDESSSSGVSLAAAPWFKFARKRGVMVKCKTFKDKFLARLRGQGVFILEF